MEYLNHGEFVFSLEQGQEQRRNRKHGAVTATSLTGTGDVVTHGSAVVQGNTDTGTKKTCL